MNATVWDVWKVDYASYDEVKRRGDVLPVVVLKALSFEAARAAVAKLGFGYSMHPHDPTKK